MSITVSLWWTFILGWKEVLVAAEAGDALHHTISDRAIFMSGGLEVVSIVGLALAWWLLGWVIVSGGGGGISIDGCGDILCDVNFWSQAGG